MLKRKQQRYYFFDLTRILHCVKTAVALAIGIFVMHVLPMPRSQWILVTIVVVMASEVHVGSILTKSILRAGGTILGALTAVLVLTFFHQDQLVYAFVVITSVLFFIYWGSSPDDTGHIGMLGVVTLILILYSSLPSFAVAFYRTVEVLLGILIASVVSAVVFPVRAKIKLKQSFYKNLANFSKLFRNTLIEHKSRLDDVATAQIDQEIYWSFPRQRKLLKYAVIESYSMRRSVKRILRLIDIERDLYRAIRLLNYLRVNNKIFFDCLESYPEYKKIANFFKELENISVDANKKIKRFKKNTLLLQDKLFIEYIGNDEMLGNVYILRFIFKQFRRKLTSYIALYDSIFSN